MFATYQSGNSRNVSEEANNSVPPAPGLVPGWRRRSQAGKGSRSLPQPGGDDRSGGGERGGGGGLARGVEAERRTWHLGGVAAAVAVSVRIK